MVDAARYRTKAQRLRDEAAKETNPALTLQLLGVAAQYDRLAVSIDAWNDQAEASSLPLEILAQRRTATAGKPIGLPTVARPRLDGRIENDPDDPMYSFWSYSGTGGPGMQASGWALRSFCN